MIQWQDLHHSQLSVPQLYALLRLRCAVFVVEQNCAYQDIDGDDMVGENRHLLAWRDNALIAYARLLKQPGEPVVIGRVIVAPQARGEKLGNRLMKEALNVCANHWPDSSIYLGAQAHLQRFYRQFGFIPVTDVYDEDGIAHIGMARG
ncbi:MULTISPECIES: GNAT family N-acetyltransferase [Tenebrionibacter/Tenebrionicola group]|jgi:ElaA protein|uniref:Protein ElaA n=2 Tax=Tenebrionibacter/Tenebrionicola group TaxID=2969848 RepID=A0A8K0XW54_9ENTR|nr:MULTISPECIES: GNAT family N-acetyltransferase [Tenebrionibacter/Tenebrionicola group]MBK4714093.1 GNAT family N-acetyltransferase [Tenebrionibacter intestinalis]MBV5094779.1 GNAT family N-acetyltransferase [Tenebrionicola larvae]